MQQPESRYDFIAIMLHWITAIMIAGQFAVVWFMRSTAQNESQWNFYFSLHLIVGFFSVFMVLFWIGWRLSHKPPSYPESVSDGERYLALAVYFMLYFCMLLLPVSGYLQLDFAAPVVLLGKHLNLWLEQDESLNMGFRFLHTGLAFLLIALIVLHIMGVISHLLRRTGVFSRMFLCFHSPSRELMLPGFTGPSRKYQNTSVNFLIFGWLAFLIQLLIAIVTVLLLVFAMSGNQGASGSASGNEGSIFWAQCGVISLFVTIAFFYFNTRYAHRIKQQQDVVLHAHKKRIIFLLRFGLFSGYAGIIIAILGVTESIQLLIAKTISQPPGIAITDPSKIVRALDVFVLVSNFAVVIAHFIGIIVWLWLLNRVDRNY